MGRPALAQVAAEPTPVERLTAELDAAHACAESALDALDRAVEQYDSLRAEHAAKVDAAQAALDAAPTLENSRALEDLLRDGTRTLIDHRHEAVKAARAALADAQGSEREALIALKSELGSPESLRAKVNELRVTAVEHVRALLAIRNQIGQLEHDATVAAREASHLLAEDWNHRDMRLGRVHGATFMTDALRREVGFTEINAVIRMLGGDR